MIFPSFSATGGKWLLFLNVTGDHSSHCEKTLQLQNSILPLLSSIFLQAEILLVSQNKVPVTWANLESMLCQEHPVYFGHAYRIAFILHCSIFSLWRVWVWTLLTFRWGECLTTLYVQSHPSICHTERLRRCSKRGKHCHLSSRYLWKTTFFYK